MQAVAEVDLTKYNVPPEAHNKAAGILKEKFEKGVKQIPDAQAMIQKYVPYDTLIPDRRHVQFGVKDGQVHASYPDPERQCINVPIHRHALNQLAEQAKMPTTFVSTLLDRGHPVLLAKNLHTLFRDDPPGKGGEPPKHLLRLANGKLMGFLSDRFDRYQDSEVIATVLQNAAALGAKPTYVRHFETHLNVRLMLGQVYQPFPGEALAFGLEAQFAQFGGWAFKIMQYIERVWCLNGCTTKYGFRRVHLGSELNQENFSKETMDLRTQFMVSASKDMVQGLFSPVSIKRRLDMVAEAHKHEVDIKHTLQAMVQRSRLGKGERERIEEIMTSNNADELPPLQKIPQPGHTSAYRLANAFSLFAQEVENEERGLELNELAGEIIDIGGKDEEDAKKDFAFVKEAA